MVHSAENQADLCGTEEDTEHDKIGSCDIDVLWTMDGSENGSRKEWQQHSADQMGYTLQVSLCKKVRLLMTCRSSSSNGR
jgi:hypothetical protein